MFFLFWALCFIRIQGTTCAQYRPVVLMHGLLSTAGNMSDLASWIRQSYEGIHVVQMEIGNGHDDSLLLPMNQQVEIFCQNILTDVSLSNGFNLVGVSQGGLIVRAAVEKCSLPVHNLITLVGPHEGVFGIPDDPTLPEQFRQLLSKFAYDEFVQKTLSVAGYWRDPYRLNEYLQRCQFLPDINNEREITNQTYRLNMIQLNSFVMVYSDMDDVVSPPQSGWFLGYQPNSLNVQTLNQSRQFTEDLIGLATLAQHGKLFQFISHTKHRDAAHAPDKDFFMKYILPFFNNTVASL